MLLLHLCQILVFSCLELLHDILSDDDDDDVILCYLSHVNGVAPLLPSVKFIMWFIFNLTAVMANIF